MTDGANRLLVLAVVALTVATLSILFWLLPGAGAWGVWDLAFVLWQAMPFALLLLLHRHGFSDIGAVLTSVAVAGLYVWGYVDIERSDSSTAALGLLFLPTYFGLLVVIAWLVDLGTRRVLHWTLKRP